MGLFSSSTKTIVGTSVSRLIPDNLLPDTPRTAILQALLKGGNITDYLIEGMAHSIGATTERMYAYGGSGRYPMGLPSGEFASNLEIVTALREILENQEGGTVEIEYAIAGPFNFTHMAWQRIIQDYDWRSSDNTVKVDGSTPWVGAGLGAGRYALFDFGIVVLESRRYLYAPETVSQMGYNPQQGPAPGRAVIIDDLGNSSPAPVEWTPVGYSTTISREQALVTVSWESGGGDGTTVANFNSFKIDLGYYDQWTEYVQARYRKTGGEWKYFTYRIGLGTYPTLDEAATEPDGPLNGEFFPFLHFRNNKISMGANKASPEYKASKKMAKYLGMDYDAVLDAIHENPDIKDVAQAYVMMAIPASSTVQVECRYLYEFMNAFEAGSLDGGETINEYFGVVNAIFIQDTKVRMSLLHTGIKKVRINGVIGPVGHHSNVWEYIPGSWWSKPTMHRYRKQVNPYQYDEIQVENLEMRYLIEGNHYTTGDDNDPIFLIPLDHTITETYSLREREELYGRSLHLVANSIVRIKVKWYQSGWFGDFLQVVGIVLFIYTLGQSAPLNAAIAAGSYATAAMIILTQVVINLAIGYALQLFVKIVGVDIAFLAALAVALYTGAKMIAADNFRALLPFAEEMLKLAGGLVKAAMTEAVEELKGDWMDFEKMREEATGELERAKKLLEPSQNILQPITIFGESPDQFFDRTVHSGNIGTVCFDMLHNYVDMSLKLPEFQSTINIGEA